MSQTQEETKTLPGTMSPELRRQLDRASAHYEKLHWEEEIRDFIEFRKRKEAEKSPK